jgi:hypothetical protein
MLLMAALWNLMRHPASRALLMAATRTHVDPDEETVKVHEVNRYSFGEIVT